MNERWEMYREPGFLMEMLYCVSCEYTWAGVRPLAMSVICPQCHGALVLPVEEVNFERTVH